MNKIIISIIILLFITACGNSDTESGKYTDDYPITSKIEYAVDVKNDTGRELKKARLLLYAPVDKTGNQKVVKLDIKQQHKVSKDALGNQIISISYEQVKPEMEDQVVVAAEVQMATEPNLIRQADIATYRQINRSIPGDEKEQLKSVTQSLQSDDVVATLRAITQWIETNLAIEKDDHLAPHPPVSINPEMGSGIGRVSFAEKKGSLRGNANITLDMAKSLGIPVRWVAGVSLKGNGRIKLENTKLWLQFLQDDKWRLFDTAEKEEVKDYSKVLILRLFPGYLDMNIEKPEQLLYEVIGITKQ